MQIKNNRSKYLQKSWIITLIKALLLAGCLFFIYSKLRNQTISFIEMRPPEGFQLVLATVLILMVINWYLEALRWKALIGLFEPITIKEAWKTVLGGLALNWMLPFTSGDLIARISQQKDKYQATSAVIFSRGIMLGVTLIFGLYGMSFLTREYALNWWIFFGVIAGVLLLVLLFKNQIERFRSYFELLTKHLFLQVIAISLLRYFVFTFQFYLLLATFLPSLDAQVVIAGIGWVFLARSVLPLLFGGIGVREASGIFFFEPYHVEVQPIIVPIFFIWIINTVLPSLIGLIFIWRLKFVRK
ncbi:MAG: lysylphosphatidylglycerol synthase domain-containing protein [Ekhidna sp.]